MSEKGADRDQAEACLDQENADQDTDGKHFHVREDQGKNACGDTENTECATYLYKAPASNRSNRTSRKPRQNAEPSQTKPSTTKNSNTNSLVYC